jgi:hypothetical protein
MCLSNNAYESTRIDFSCTVEFAFETGPDRHTLGYFNRVRARPGSPGVKKQGNAMLLPIPARPGSIELVSAGKMPHVFTDYRDAITPAHERLEKLDCWGLVERSLKPLVVKGFDDGVYDVVISPSARAISSVLGQVAEDKRPADNHRLYTELDALYGRGFQFVLYCFGEDTQDRAGGAIINYKPHAKWRHQLFAPALDGHNGHVEIGDVKLDHALVFGSYLMNDDVGLPVEFSDVESLFHNFLLRRVIGTTTQQTIHQGDFVAQIEDVREGRLQVARTLPPNWQKRGYPMPALTTSLLR